MPIEVKAYKCSHGCGKYLLTKTWIVKHEELCYYNPAVKGCITCIRRTTVDYDDGECICGRWYCTVHGKYLESHGPKPHENEIEMALQNGCINHCTNLIEAEKI